MGDVGGNFVRLRMVPRKTGHIVLIDFTSSPNFFGESGLCRFLISPGFLSGSEKYLILINYYYNKDFGREYDFHLHWGIFI